MNTQKGSMGIEIICQQAPKPKNSGKLVYKQLSTIFLSSKYSAASYQKFIVSWRSAELLDINFRPHMGSGMDNTY